MLPEGFRDATYGLAIMRVPSEIPRQSRGGRVVEKSKLQFFSGSGVTAVLSVKALSSEASALLFAGTSIALPSARRFSFTNPSSTFRRVSSERVERLNTVPTTSASALGVRTSMGLPFGCGFT